MKKFLLLLCFLGGLQAATFAQEGTVRGTMTDLETGEALMFANVLVKDTNPMVGTETDLDGVYEIKLAPGSYSLEYSYVGYNAKTVTDVEVIAGEVTLLDIAMGVEGELLEEIVVKAQAIKNSENAILSLQRKALTVQDGISSQEMSRFGTSTAAETMSKVTGASVVGGQYIFVRGLGDRYTSAQLNGLVMPSTDPYRNVIQLDLIPSNLLDNIIVSKSFTPDQPGNFTGGNVNLETKSFPERFMFTASVSATYNSQSSLRDDFLTHTGGKTDWLGFDDGSRDIPAILQSSSYLDTVTTSTPIRARRDKYQAELLDQGIKSLDGERAPITKSSFLDHNIDFSLGNQFLIGKNDNPLGLLVGLNYRRSFEQYDNGKDAFFELTDPESDLNIFRDLTDTRGQEDVTMGGMLNLSYKFGGNNKLSFISIINNIGSQDNRVLEGSFPAIISGNGAFQTRALRWQERTLQNYQLAGEHVLGANGFKIEWAGGLVNFKQNDPNFRQFSNTYRIDQTDGTRTHSISPAEFDLPFHFYRSLDDQQYSGKLDVTIPFFKTRNSSNHIKIGGSYSDKTRTFQDRVFQINIPTTLRNYTRDNAESVFAEENLGITEFNPETERYTIGLWALPFEKPTKENSYDGYEKIAAGYAMVVYNINRLKIIAGARVENTDIYVQSQDESLPEGTIQQTDVLPALNLVYKLSENANLRLSGTQTLARPNMRELAPFISFDFGGGNRIQGNPNLERTLIQNLDLRWELFPRAGELFAASVYYKSFDNPIVTAFVPESANPLIRYTNVDQATVYGFEFEFRKKLDFISPTLENFRFSTNFSLIKSIVDIPEMEQAIIDEFNPEKGDTRQFQGQSPFLLNASINYNNADIGLDATLAYNVFGRRLAIISEAADPDVFEESAPALDLIISKTLTQRFSLKLSARNLLNPARQQTMEFRGKEYTLQNYKLGRDFGMGISYRF